MDRIARQPNTVVVSCELDLNLDYLIESIWKYLDLMRVYTKKKGDFPDFAGGFIVKCGVNVDHVCKAIHQTLSEECNVIITYWFYFMF